MTHVHFWTQRIRFWAFRLNESSENHTELRNDQKNTGSHVLAIFEPKDKRKNLFLAKITYCSWLLANVIAYK